jgi:alpha-1,2-mannosyltransferase
MGLSRAVDEQEFHARARFIGVAGLVLSLAAWVFHFQPFDDWLDGSGTPVGADFACYYVAGRMVLDGRTDELYDPAAAEQELGRLFPTLAPGESLPFRYPPFVAGLVAPLALLPYPWALGLFSLVSLAMLGLAWRMLSRQLEWPADRAWRNTVLMLLAGWPVVSEVVLGGQWSLFTLAIVATTTYLLSRERTAAAGAVLALGMFKPTALVFFAAGLILRRPRMLVGAVPAGLALVGLSAAVVGFDGLGEYARLGSRLAAGRWDVPIDLLKFHGLLPWLEPWLPTAARGVTFGCGAMLTAGIALAWRRSESLPAADRRRFDYGAYAALLGVGALFGTYVPIYDLVLTGAALLFAAEAFRTPAAGRRSPTVTVGGATLFWFVFCGPHVSQAFYPVIGQNLYAPIALAAAATAVGRTIVATAKRGGFTKQAGLPLRG